LLLGSRPAAVISGGGSGYPCIVALPRLQQNNKLASNTESMPISVQIEDEHGVREGEAWWHARSTEAIVGEHPGTCCLRFVDPYGDTVFNRGQMPVLLDELRALRRNHPDPELASIIAELCTFIEPAVDQVQTPEYREHTGARHLENDPCAAATKHGVAKAGEAVGKGAKAAGKAIGKAADAVKDAVVGDKDEKK